MCILVSRQAKRPSAAACLGHLISPNPLGGLSICYAARPPRFSGSEASFQSRELFQPVSEYLETNLDLSLGRANKQTSFPKADSRQTSGIATERIYATIPTQSIKLLTYLAKNIASRLHLLRNMHAEQICG